VVPVDQVKLSLVLHHAHVGHVQPRGVLDHVLDRRALDVRLRGPARDGGRRGLL
jgi:hypothetical protein